MKAFVYGETFSRLVLTIIIVNSLLIGVETYIQSPVIHLIQTGCLYFFLAEIILKFIYRDSTKAFFSEPWNLFDIAIVGSAFLPNISSIATALRVLRVLRVLRLIRGIPELRLIVDVLLKSLKSMTYICLLMFITFYLYAILGVELFGETQKEYSSLHEAFFSLFRSLTCEDWTDLRYDGIEHSNYLLVTLYHVSWIILGTFLMINLVVGAIINNYQDIQDIEKSKKVKADDEELFQKLEELQNLINARKTQALQ